MLIPTTTSALTFKSTTNLYNSTDLENKIIEKSMEKELLEKYGKNYKKIVAKNNASAESANKIYSLFAFGNPTKIKYPDFFGGQYINDNQDLVIQVVKENVSNDNIILYNQVISVDPNAKIEYVDNLYKDLENVNNEIINYFSKSNSQYTNLISNYIDTEKNKVIVELENMEQNEIDKFKELVIDSKLIEFKKGNQIVSTANPGSTVRYANGTTIEECTRGYRAKISGTNRAGFVIAAHCVQNGGDYGAGGKVSGYKLGGNVDAAFLETSETITTTLQYSVPGLPNTTQLEAYNNSIVLYVSQGQMIGKNGAVTGAQTGTIINPMVSINLNVNGTKVYITKLVKANAKNVEGDSGGPVFTIGSAKGKVLGITSGRDENSTSSTYFSRADFINSTLGITEY